MRWRMASLPIRDSRTWRGTLPLRNPGTLNSWLSLRTVSEVSLSISDGSTSTRRRTLVGLSRSTVVFIERHRSAEFPSLDGGWGAFWRRLRPPAGRSGAFRRGTVAFRPLCETVPPGCLGVPAAGDWSVQPPCLGVRAAVAWAFRREAGGGIIG